MRRESSTEPPPTLAKLPDVRDVQANRRMPIASLKRAREARDHAFPKRMCFPIMFSTAHPLLLLGCLVGARSQPTTMPNNGVWILHTSSLPTLQIDASVHERSGGFAIATLRIISAASLPTAL